MNQKIIIIIVAVAGFLTSFVENVYGQYEARQQHILSVVPNTSSPDTEDAGSQAMPNDNRSWLYLRTGMQTNGVGYARSWTISLQYDIRNEGPIGLYSDLQVWRHLQLGNSPVKDESFSTVANLACGFHVHFNVGKGCAGILAGIGTPIYTVISPQYGITLEYPLSNQYRLSVSQKKIGCLDHFVFIGIMGRLN